MRIPEKRSRRFITFKKVVLSLSSLALLAVIWIQINAFSSETQISIEDLIIAEVEKGDLIREVRAPGTLVPVELNFLTATSSGRVKNILLEAGDPVEVGTVIMTLDNPELSKAVDTAQYELEILQAEFGALEARQHQQILKQRIVVADFTARFEMATLRRDANRRLSKTDAVSTIDLNESILLNDQLKFQTELEIELLESLPALIQSELAAAQAETNKAIRQLALQQELADDLFVKSTSQGMLQEVPLENGEQFTVGTVLARVARQDNLKAELRVQESQVKGVTKNQSVVISAGGKFALGVVKRIDPAVQQGVVIVDVYFTDGILEGARPDLRVDGVIELEHLKDILKIKRPVFSQEYSPSDLFVLNEHQDIAERKRVELGRSSIDAIEVLSTLREGDQVVVSDTNKYRDLTQIRLRK